MNKLAQMLGYGGLTPQEIGNALMKPRANNWANTGNRELPPTDWNRSVLKPLVDAYTLPARVYRGEADPRDIGEALNFATTLGLGGLGIARPRGIGVRTQPKAETVLSERGYRGSPSNAERFRGENSRGLWASDNPAIASSYADGGGMSDNVMPVQFDFTNPMIHDAKGARWFEIPFDGKTVRTDDLRKQALARGHDGLVVRNVVDALEDQTGAVPSTVYHAISRGTVRSPITGEVLYSNGSPLPFAMQQYYGGNRE